MKKVVINKISIKICKCGCGLRLPSQNWNYNLRRPKEYLRGHNLKTMGSRGKGELAPNWKGGKSLLRDQICRLYQYRQWRSDVFTRDDYTCQDCGVRGGDLEGHHIREFCKIVSDNNIKNTDDAIRCSELWNINNGLTLCKKCHNKTKFGRFYEKELEWL